MEFRECDAFESRRFPLGFCDFAQPSSVGSETDQNPPLFFNAIVRDSLPYSVDKRRLHNNSVVRIKRFASRFQIRRRISAKGSTLNRTDLPPNNNTVALMSSRHYLWQIIRRASIDRRVNYLHFARAVFAVFRTRRCWTRNYDEILSLVDQQIIEALNGRKKGTGN